ncbi:MAG: Mur ligase domain-containing protein, partial [Bacteroidota bacterium]
MKKPLLDTSLLAVPFKGAAGIKEVCFIGIGGIGMSALARFFLEQGVAVTGYDKTRTMLTAQLEEAGMQIHYKDSLEYLSRGADIVVYTPAIPTDHLELNWYRDNGYTVYKRSDLLQRITEGSFNICIAGTHGKTTTSTLVAHILRYSGIGCNAFLGGIASNYGTNYWSSTTNCCVVEADEYDRSFLKLRPHLALITAMDPDHLDIYGTAEAMEEAFLSFSSLVASGGLLLYKKGLKRTEALRAPQLLSYHLHDTSADCRSIGLRVQEG